MIERTSLALMAATAGALTIGALAACNPTGARGTAVGGAAPLAQRTEAPPSDVSVARRVPVGPIPGPGTADLPPNPYEGDPESLVEGRRLFVRFNCSGCHGGRAGGGMGPSLRDPEWLYGAAPARIHDSIAAGRAYGMPAWGTLLPDDQIWKLTAYIQSLGTDAEPNAPR